MDDKNKKKYKPGELQRTRDRLGDMDEYEARIMKDRLGGEIGFEHDEDLDKKYAQLKKRKQDNNSQIVDLAASYGKFKEDNEEKRAGMLRSYGPSSPMGYIERIKTDLLCLEDGYQLKTLGSVIQAFFSFLIKSPDYINPQFIIDGDKIFVAPIERLVISVRKLLTTKRKLVQQNIRKTPWIASVLKVLKDWDVESINEELFLLQRYPREITLKRMLKLIRKVFAPIMVLKDVDLVNHLGVALKKLYDYNILSVAKNSPEENEVKQQYLTARNELKTVFHDVKRRFYPLLMKLTANVYIEYENFFGLQRDRLLVLFDLTEDEVLNSRVIQSQEILDSLPTEEEVIEETSDGTPHFTGLFGEEPEGEKVLYPPAVRKGLQFLDTMFPDAGWKEIHDFPDFFAYYKNLLNVPKGSELVSTRDPLHIVIMLLSILQELFYGFRYINFGYLKSNTGDSLSVQEMLDKVLNKWHFFQDELIGKQYMHHLQEFCRQMERTSSYGDTSYGRKKYYDLVWLKKLFIFPHLEITEAKGFIPKININSEPLFEHVAELRNILSKVVIDIANKNDKTDNCMSIRNLKEPMAFEVPGRISSRFKTVLIKKWVNEEGKTIIRDEYNNQSLIMYTLLVVMVLDYVLNDQNNIFYENPTESFFRTTEDSRSVPNYHVKERKNLPSLHKPVDKKHLLLNIHDINKAVNYEEISGFPNEMILRDFLQGKIDLYDKQSSAFFAICLGVKDLVEESGSLYPTKADKGVEVVLRAISDIIRFSIREVQDIPYKLRDDKFIIIMNNIKRDDVIAFAKRLKRRFKNHSMQKLVVYQGILSFHRGWNEDKFIKTAYKTLEEAESYPDAVIAVFDVLRNSYEIIDEFSES